MAFLARWSRKRLVAQNQPDWELKMRAESVWSAEKSVR